MHVASHVTIVVGHLMLSIKHKHNKITYRRRILVQNHFGTFRVAVEIKFTDQMGISDTIHITTFNKGQTTCDLILCYF